MEAVSVSETSVNVYQTTQRNKPEGSHLHTLRCGNLKSHRSISVFQRCFFCYTDYLSSNVIMNVGEDVQGSIRRLFRRDIPVFFCRYWEDGPTPVDLSEIRTGHVPNTKQEL
jgi:hypothetical protein